MTRKISTLASLLFACAALAAPALAENPALRELKPGDVVGTPDPGPVLASPQSEAPPAPLAPVALAAPQPAAPVQGDPYGFGAWLNGERARRGLHSLAHDSGLSSDAAVNSSRISLPNFYATAHNFMGRARRQNAGWGDGATVWSKWTTSNGHWQALFDRSATSYGIACINGAWTYSAY